MSDKQENIPARPTGFPMRGGMGGGRIVEKPKNFKGTINNLIKYARPYRISIILVFIFAIASTVFAIVGPKILGSMTNLVVSDYSRRLEIDFVRIGQIALQLLFLYLISAIFSYVQGYLMSDIAQKITYRFRKEISEKINFLPIRYFDTRTHGEVLSRVTNDVDTISQTLNQSLTQIIISVTMIIGILVMMLSISWQLTIVALIVLPSSFGIIGKIIKKSQTYFKDQQEILGTINGYIEEMYSGHSVVKIFNGEKRTVAEFQKINNKLYKSAWKSQFLSGLMMPIMNFMGNLGYVFVAALGGWLAIQGRINIGDIQAFIQYVNQFNQPIVQTANITNILQSTAAAAERVFEFLEQSEEIPEVEKPISLSSVSGGIEFDNVVFGYSAEKVIIKGFSAHVKPGQRVAIVGPTGAGKTTIVNLLMRFYDVDKGSIKIDGVDIRDMKRSALRKMFGMVLQDTWLFNGTIKENIAYGNQKSSDQEIIAAAKAAHVDHFVRSLPLGYNMIISEEADNISQGEKQLLTIARAMLANSPMLILDEATSSVDTRTEVLIQEAMTNLMKGRTCFVIAHRLSTIRNADLIFVMNEGNIVEQGTHEQLINRKGFYESLYNSQFSESETVQGIS
jgi:ATP-binding cassette, subfamily B, multidrug efflux pump